LVNEPWLSLGAKDGQIFLPLAHVSAVLLWQRLDQLEDDAEFVHVQLEESQCMP
jgi:hypothetical protein